MHVQLNPEAHVQGETKQGRQDYSNFHTDEVTGDSQKADAIVGGTQEHEHIESRKDPHGA